MNFVFNEELSMKLGFFNPLIGIVKELSDDNTSTLFPLFLRY